MNRIKTDVLVIGGGGAACRAAVEAHDAGASVLMVLKGKIGESGATTYRFSEMAGMTVSDDLNPEDSKEIFYQDIISAGLGMADPEVVQTLVDNARARKDDLENWGTHFERDQEGNYLSLLGCFASRPRGYMLKDHGRPIVNALLKQIKLRNIQVMENAMILSLAVHDGVCAGALGLDEKDELTLFEAKAVVMAAGGMVRIFKHNVNPPDVTGDGYAIAHRAGVKQCNLEFMQSGVGYMYPKIGAFFCYVWAGLPNLYNGNGEKFLQNYLPQGITEKDVMLQHSHHFPFSTRDISKYIDIAVQKEIAEGRGTKHGGIVIDFKHFTPEYVSSINYDMKNMWPRTLEFYRNIGMDFLKDEIELAIFGHAVNGGIKIDKAAQSSMPGLYAAGEVAAGSHGADRLGGAMLLTSQVFGKIAGENAADFAKRQAGVRLEEAEVLAQAEPVLEVLHKTLPIAAYTKELQESASRNLLLCKSEASLNRMLETLDRLEGEIAASPSCDKISREALALSNELLSARLMTSAARERKESRGSHYREDYPELDPRFERPIFV